MLKSSSEFCRCAETHSLTKLSRPQQWYSGENLSERTVDPHPAFGKYRILKNVILLSVSHFLFYQTTITLNNLQSTLNSEGGVGVACLAVQDGMAMLCVLFLSNVLLRTFGCRKMLILGIALQVPYHASNFHPDWEIMLPASALSGCTLGLIPMGVSLYVNEMSLLYHSMQRSESKEVITSRFFGIFTFFALNSSVWGNLVSYFALLPDALPEFNRTDTMCGVDFDSDVDNDNLRPPSDEKRYVLVGVCLSMSVLGMVLLVFVDELDLKADDKTVADERGLRSVMLSMSGAARHICVPVQLLLMPLTVFYGIQNAFFNADFTRAFVACSWGVYHIGFVAMCFGVCGAFIGSSIGCLVRCTSQVFTMILAAFMNAFVIVFLFGWNPSPCFVEAYFVVAGLWGMANGIWWSQLGAAYGLFFPENREEAFSVMYFFVFLGYAIDYSTSNYLTIRVKLISILSLLIIGMMGYLIGQTKAKRLKKLNDKSAHSSRETPHNSINVSL